MTYMETYLAEREWLLATLKRHGLELPVGAVNIIVARLATNVAANAAIVEQVQSRSRARRIAAQRGEPAPEFTRGPVLSAPTEMIASPDAYPGYALVPIEPSPMLAHAMGLGWESPWEGGFPARWRALLDYAGRALLADQKTPPSGS